MKTLTSWIKCDSIHTLLGGTAAQPTAHVTAGVNSNTNSRLVYFTVKLLFNSEVFQIPFNVIWGITRAFQEVTSGGEVFSHLKSNATVGVWKNFHTAFIGACVDKTLHWVSQQYNTSISVNWEEIEWRTGDMAYLLHSAKASVRGNDVKCPLWHKGR